MKTKKCSTCKKTKTIDRFYNLKSSKDKLTYDCSNCCKEKSMMFNKKKAYERLKNRVFEKGEVWIKIKDTNNYEISNLGNLYSYRAKRNLKKSIGKKGYLLVKIFRTDGTKYSIAIHILVAIYFLKKSNIELNQVNHIDGDKTNNKAVNLEWVSCKQNINHAINMGLRDRCINLKSKAMFTRKQVLNIKTMIRNGFGNRYISKIYNCDHSTISKIRSGSNYKNINLK